VREPKSTISEPRKSPNQQCNKTKIDIELVTNIAAGDYTLTNYRRKLEFISNRWRSLFA